VKYFIDYGFNSLPSSDSQELFGNCALVKLHTSQVIGLCLYPFGVLQGQTQAKCIKQKPI
jgi:hypothetical protein